MTTKMAVSLPDDVFQALEQSRKRLDLSRSAAVQQAIRQWSQQQERQQAVAAYIASYSNHPEAEVEPAWLQAQAWGAWED